MMSPTAVKHPAPMAEFKVDSVASALKAGERPTCAGLVLVVGWSWGSDRSTGYDELASDIATLAPDALHVYGNQHLHSTVATLSRYCMSQSAVAKSSCSDICCMVGQACRAYTNGCAVFQPRGRFDRGVGGSLQEKSERQQGFRRQALFLLMYNLYILRNTGSIFPKAPSDQNV